ncbi:MAG TPA: hypothetical protein VIP11_10940, partial [Gemmatimonadaceae bacterium]
GALLALAACSDAPTNARRNLTPGEPSKTTVPNGWTITIDGPQPPQAIYMGPSPFPSADTAWVTVRDQNGAARYDTNISNWMATCTPGLSCQIVSRGVVGGTQWGYIVSVDPNVEAFLYLGLQRDNLTTSTTDGIYRGIGVWSIHGPFASSYTFTPLQTAQFVDTAFSRWNQNVSAYFPASYSISNPAVGSVSSGGFFTATDCGTANVTVSRGGKTASHSVSVSPCVLHVTINGPSVVKPNTPCTWSVSVTGGSGTLSNVHWYSDDSGMGDGSPITINTMYLDSFNPLNVRVTDANGTVGFAQKTITIDGNAPNCS